MSERDSPRTFVVRLDGRIDWVSRDATTTDKLHKSKNFLTVSYTRRDPASIKTGLVSFKVQRNAMDVSTISGGANARPFLLSRESMMMHDCLREERDRVWPQLSKLYVAEMRASYKAHRAAWLEVLARPSVLVTCYCRPSPDGVVRCHRVLLAKIFAKLGAVYEGEAPWVP